VDNVPLYAVQLPVPLSKLGLLTGLFGQVQLAGGDAGQPEISSSISPCLFVPDDGKLP